MLKRIRRTAARLRERYFHKGRHRRPARPVRPLAASPEVAHNEPLLLRQGGQHTGVHRWLKSGRRSTSASRHRRRHPPFGPALPWQSSL